jgi:hypothetical protein
MSPFFPLFSTALLLWSGLMPAYKAELAKDLNRYGECKTNCNGNGVHLKKPTNATEALYQLDGVMHIF